MRPFSLLLCSWVLLCAACGDDSPRRSDEPAEAGVAAPGPLDAGADAGPPNPQPRGDAGPESDARVPADAMPAIADVRLPPDHGGLDYQLGGPYAPVAGTLIVSRDRQAAPAPGLYNVCYVNGFQTQPDEASFWLEQQPDLVLRDGAGKPVIDPDWDELLLDISSAEKRTRLAAIVGGWIAACATSGFAAVEIDNLDTYSRSGGRLSEDYAVAFVRLLADAAHAKGLAIAQKNASELVSRKAEMATDFVVTEQCNRYDECDVYIGAYGAHVLMVEYRREDFVRGCKAYSKYPLVLRDLQLKQPGQSGYVFEGC